jgi:TonB-dependent receptor
MEDACDATGTASAGTDDMKGARVKTFRIRAIANRGAASMIALVTGLAFAPAAFAQTAASPTQVPTDTTGTQAVEAAPEAVATVQDPATPDTAANTDPQDIIVTGTRASLQSAIARKKNAGTVVDSIVADDIASFPDKNVGEALARVTGIQLSRDFGEGTAVSIRGIEPDLNRVEINGVSQQSAGGSRAGDFRELASELVKSVDVYKGYTVDLTEGGIGGTISVETRRPLELKAPIFSIKGEAQRLDLARQWGPRFNFLAGRSDLFGGRLGVMTNVTYYKVNLRQDYISNTNWSRVADFDRSTEKTIANPSYANFATYESCSGVTGATAAAATTNRLACETQFFDWTPSSVRTRSRTIDDNRLSADFQAQLKLADNLTIWGQATYTRRDQRLRDANLFLDASNFQRFNYDTPLAANAAGGTSRPRITADTFTVEDHVVTSWLTQRNQVNTGTAASPVFGGAANNIGIQRRDFRYPETSLYLQTGFTWNLDRLSVIGLASRSKADRTNDTNLVSISTGVGSATVDRRNSLAAPFITFPTGFDPADPNTYAVTRTGANGVALAQSGPVVQYRPGEAGTSEDQAKIDFDYETDLGPLRRIEFGGQYRKLDFFDYLNGGARILTPASGSTPAVFQYNNNVSYTTVIGNAPATPAPNTYYFSPERYAQFIRETGSVLGGAPIYEGLSGIPSTAPRQLAFPQFDFGTLSRYYDLSNFNRSRLRFADGLPQIPNRVVDETIYAAYLKANFEQELFGMRLTGNAGYRYVRTEDSSTGSNRRQEIRLSPGTGVNGVPAQLITTLVSVEQVTIDNSYTDWLPALNLNLEVFNNLFVRGSFAKNMARPQPDRLAATVNCNFDIDSAVAGEDTCTAGNPGLLPYRADSYDLNISWYPNQDTLVSVGYFRKNVESFILNGQTRVGVDLFGDGGSFTVVQPINGFGAKLDGLEVSAQTAFTFLPGFFSGFGASGNFTYARALNSGLINLATQESLPFYPGLSKYTFNASAFYDKDWLNARISWNKRTRWLQTAASGNDGNNPIFRKAEAFVDAKVLFRLSPQVSVYGEALNLTKEFTQTYIDSQRTVEAFYPGRRFFLGAQFKL